LGLTKFTNNFNDFQEVQWKNMIAFDWSIIMINLGGDVLIALHIMMFNFSCSWVGIKKKLNIVYWVIQTLVKVEIKTMGKNVLNMLNIFNFFFFPKFLFQVSTLCYLIISNSKVRYFEILMALFNRSFYERKLFVCLSLLEKLV
jgi:hypothetical protein